MTEDTQTELLKRLADDFGMSIAGAEGLSGGALDSWLERAEDACMWVVQTWTPEENQRPPTPTPFGAGEPLNAQGAGANAPLPMPSATCKCGDATYPHCSCYFFNLKNLVGSSGGAVSRSERCLPELLRTYTQLHLTRISVSCVYLCRYAQYL